MAYRVEYKPAAERDLLALPPDVQRRIRPKIDALADNPRPHGVKKLKGEENTWRIRVGDYRVIYEIHDRILLVLVLRIRHRGSAYD